MPTVPSVSVPSVAPTGTSGLPYQTAAGATPEAFGAGVGAAEQKLGATVESVGDVFAKHALKMQEDVNVTVANNLFVQAGIKMGKETETLKQAQGLNASAAYDQYVKNLEKIRADTIAQAPNDDVKKKFDNEIRRRVGYSIEDGARYVGGQLKSAQNASTAAVRANNLSSIAANASDDTRFDKELQSGLATFKTEDEYKGSTPETQELKDRTFVTAAWATRLETMSKNDPLRARDLLEKNKDKMDGSKVLQLQNYIAQQIINVDTRVSSDKIIQSGALVPDNLREAVKKFEGYEETPYKDYKQVSSGYGTKAQPGDENIPPEQRKAVYEQRLTNELARAANIVDQFAPGLPTGTRNALISLTYNAGSAWTSSGLGQSIRAGDMEGARTRFLQYTKAGGVDNQVLLGRRMAESNWWGGERTESDPTTRLTTAMDAAKERAIQVFPDDPGNQAKYLDTLQSRLRSDNSVMETAARQMQLDMRNTVQKELVNGPVTSYDHLSPAAKQAYDQSPPSQQNVFNAQMRRNATADVPLTPERQNLYDELYGESKTAPDKFMARNITELDLPRTQKSKLAAMQADRNALSQKGVKLSGAMTELQPLLNDAQIAKSINDPARNAEYNKFAGVLEQRIAAFEEDKKRPPNSKEVREIGKELLTEVVTAPGYIWDSKSRGYQAIADKTPIEYSGEASAFGAHYTSIPRGATYRAPDGSLKVKR